MFEELKRKIAHYTIKKKYLRLIDEKILFKSAISDAKNVFVLMPVNESDFIESIEIVKYFHIHKKDVSIFLPESKHNIFPLTHGYRFVSYLPDQISRFFLPDKLLLGRLKDKNFDIVLDLNRQEDTFFSCVANVVKSKIRIGFRKNRSEEYYNMLFDSKQSDPSIVYKKLLEHLNMF